MRSRRAAASGFLVLFGLAGGALVRGQQGQGQAPSPYPLSNAVRATGSSVTPAFEGWYYNKDGSVSLLVGYFNRNTKQELDIPIGPNNRIEPGGPDMGQPTHFLTSRQYGVFSIKVPKDFGNKKLTWTLTVNGQTNVINLHTLADWVVEPFEDAANKNTPPVLKFDPNGPAFTGPPAGTAAKLTGIVGQPVALVNWATDEGPKINVPPPAPPAAARGRGAAPSGFRPPPPLAISWSKFRGPGSVTFAEAKPPVDKASGKAATTATFSEAGDYILRLQANDQTGDGGGGFQCCWTNAYVAVTVRAGSTSQ